MLIASEGHQTFCYLSPRLHISLADLLEAPFSSDLYPEWVHVVVRIPRAQFLVDEAARIASEGISGKVWKARMIWEPLDVKVGAGLCRAHHQPDSGEDLKSWLELAPHFAAISPNLVELQTVLSIKPRENPTPQDVVDAAELFHRLLMASSVVIVRAGAMGSYTISPEWRGWVPAFWKDQSRVVDPTGGEVGRERAEVLGGNAFLGGLCAGLLISGGDWRTGESA